MTKVPTFKSPPHRYVIDGVPTPAVTQILRGAGLSPPIYVPEAILAAKGQIGTDFHIKIAEEAKAIEDFSTSVPVLNAIEALSKTEEEKTKNWRVIAALEYLQRLGGKVVSVEEKVNLRPGVAAGTLDMVVQLKSGDYILIDWKSRKFCVWDHIQLELYRIGYNLKYPDRKIIALVVVPIPNSKSLTSRTPVSIRIPSAEHEHLTKVALSTLTVYHWKKANNLIPAEIPREEDEQADSADEDW